MESLQQIPRIKENISKASTKSIKAFHKFVFGEDGDRKNRSRLREFLGFSFQLDSDEYKQKVKWAVKEFTLGDLTAICNILRIDYTGDAEAIARRLCHHLRDFNLLNQTCDESDEDEEYESVSDGASTVASFSQRKPKFTLSFRDVEDTIRTFNGSDDYSIETWVSDFEDNATLFGWTDLQKLLFAKKSLTGLAKLFIRSEKGLSTWTKLKSRLLEEFSSKVNSALLHESLIKRKMNRNESVHEYFLVMKELASRGNIETDALIQYIVDGIPDDAHRKTTLYEARDLSELKTKLTIYDRLRTKAQRPTGKTLMYQQDSTAKVPLTYEGQTSADGLKSLRCHNCNEIGHTKPACTKPRRERGSCYVCGAMDHQKISCPQRATSSRKTDTVENTIANLVDIDGGTIPSYMVSAALDIGKTTAVLDTGSPISLINRNLIPNSVRIEKDNSNLTFQGFNKSKIIILGRLKQLVCVQNCKVYVNFYVVPETTMSYSCLLGRDYIANDKILINFGRTVIIRYNDQFRENLNPSEILQIDVCKPLGNCLLNVQNDGNLNNETRNNVSTCSNDHCVTSAKSNCAVTNLGVLEDKEFLLQNNIEPPLIATATPHVYSQIERIDRTMMPMLVQSSNTINSWNKVLSEVESPFDTVNRCVGNTLSRLLFGTNQVGNLDDNSREILESDLKDERNLDIIRDNPISKLELSNAYNKNYYDKKHNTSTNYQLGDYVMIKNVDVIPGVNKKLLPKFRGPYKIKRVLDRDRYLVCDPEGHQLIQTPFESVCSPENMKPWVKV